MNNRNENIVIHVADVEFGCYEPHYEIEYKGKRYRAIDIRVTENGTDTIVTIADIALQYELFNGVDARNVPNECFAVDEKIAFYAQANDGIYGCIENIYDEPVRYAA